MRASAVAIVLVATLLAACGGDGLSARDYRTRLDAACGKLAAAQARIPRRVRDENLDIGQADEIARRNGDEFVETVRDQDPPDDLRDAHDRLIDLTEEEPPSGGDRAAVERWILRHADAYRAVGARGCEEGQRRAARMVAEGR